MQTTENKIDINLYTVYTVLNYQKETRLCDIRGHERAYGILQVLIKCIFSQAL